MPPAELTPPLGAHAAINRQNNRQNPSTVVVTFSLIIIFYCLLGRTFFAVGLCLGYNIKLECLIYQIIVYLKDISFAIKLTYFLVLIISCRRHSRTDETVPLSLPPYNPWQK